MESVLRISGRGALTVTLYGLTREQADLYRTRMQSILCGADLRSVPLSVSETDSPSLVLTALPDQFRSFSAMLRKHTAFPPEISAKIASLLDNYLRTDYKITCRGKALDLGRRTLVMGILNVTPDSFSDGGRFFDPGVALAHAREMAAAGADIIDIGGESTRPGSLPLSEEEELRRIIPLFERLSAELPVPLSVDTYKSGVARKALQAGASIVNDISGLRFSPDMAKVAADAGAPVVIMHIKGTPRNMQQNPVYEDVVGEILSYLGEGIAIAERAGVDREQVLVDPGIGFGKTLEHNIAIISRLDEFRALGRPIVLGTSRKKFIGAILGIETPSERVEGTAATVAAAIERGAAVVRVHDVRQMAMVARMTDAIVKKH